jgi:hypothetical protein
VQAQALVFSLHLGSYVLFLYETKRLKEENLMKKQAIKEVGRRKFKEESIFFYKCF